MLLDKLLSHLAVEVEPFALCLVSPSWRLRLPGPPAPMLHFVLQGKGTVRGPSNEPHPLAPFWLVVVPPGMSHALESGDVVESELTIDAPPQGQPVHSIVAGSSQYPALLIACGIVSVRYGPSLGLFDHLKDVLAVDLSDRPQVTAAFQAILAEQAQPGPGQNAMMAALMTQCLVHLFRRVGSGPSGALPWLTALEDARLARAIDLILENPAAEYTVESLAETASMSRSAFTERFTAAFGRSPMNLLQHVRMQHAASLLRRDAELSVDEVATRVGYASRSHFSDAFRKHHGVAPTAFRVSY